jgi:predicted amidohydrolase YtcJ
MNALSPFTGIQVFVQSRIASRLALAVFGVANFCSAAALAADAPQPADLVIRNAKVITVDKDFSVAQAVAVRGVQIVAVGSDRHMERFTGANTKVIDAQGKIILPGLCDNNVHSYQAAASEMDGMTPDFKSITEALEYIRKQAAAKPTNGWIVLNGLYPFRLSEGRLPTLAELDTAAPYNPVYWSAGAIGVANTKAIHFSNITNSTLNPPLGEIVREPITDKPTGLIRNAAGLLKITNSVPRPSPQKRRDALKHLYEIYNQQGITSIDEQDAQPEAIDLFRDLSKAGELTVRVNCARPIQLGTNLDESLARLTAMAKGPQGAEPYGPTGMGDIWVRIGPLTTIMDGSVSDGSAYLRTPWGLDEAYQIANPSYRGVVLQDMEQLHPLYLEAAKRGWRLSSRCAGDSAMELLLNCYEFIQLKMDIRERRFLISQGTFISQRDLDRCKQLGVGIGMQPIWLYRDGGKLIKLLGEQRMQSFLPLKNCFETGVTAGGGSGHETGLDPLHAVHPCNPWLGIWITLTRQVGPGNSIIQSQVITREQALRLYTINNAWLNSEEKFKGSLEPGKLADLIMIDRDVLKCPLDSLPETKVLMTMVGGKVVWEAK